MAKLCDPSNSLPPSDGLMRRYLECWSGHVGSWTRAPLTDEEAQRICGMETRGEVVLKPIYDDGHHLDRREHLMTLPMQFNRCALEGLRTHRVAHPTLLVRAAWSRFRSVPNRAIIFGAWEG